MMRYMCSCVKFFHNQHSMIGDILRRRPFLLVMSTLSSHVCNPASYVFCNKKSHYLTLSPSMTVRGVDFKSETNFSLHAGSPDKWLSNVAGSGYHCINNFRSHTKGTISTVAVRDANKRHLTISAKAIVDASPVSLQPYLKLIRFDRPIGTWLLFLPCTWSISLSAPAGHLPDVWMLTLFAIGSFSMRSAACTINDMLDKDLDAQVARTRDRPLACGQISQFNALSFLALPLSVSLGVLLTFNWNTIALGVCSMVPCVVYPLMKRITYWPQAFLGITLNWGVMIAWSAINGSLGLPGVVLYASCVLWTMIYDTIYSHQDKEDDIKVGVKSTALKLGDSSKLWLSAFATGVTGGLATVGYLCQQSPIYYLGVCTVASHLAYQIYSVKLNDAESCAGTFRSNRDLGLVFWAFIVAAGLLSKDSSSEKDDGCPDNN